MKIMFWIRWFIAYSNEWNWREKERCLFTLTDLLSHHVVWKIYLFFDELAISQRSAVFCAAGAWGGKPIGRVRVNIIYFISLFLKYFFQFNQSTICFKTGKRESLSDKKFKFNDTGKFHFLLIFKFWSSKVDKSSTEAWKFSQRHRIFSKSHNFSFDRFNDRTYYVWYRAK